MLFFATIPTVMFAFGLTFVALPWQPIAILGTALAFIVGFKNNASYGRLWEARQIYGGIINDSRSLAFTLRDALGPSHARATKILLYRHFAWLTALRYQLRESRTWENMQQANNKEFRRGRFVVPEWDTPMADALKPYLSEKDLTRILANKNKATQLMAMQSEAIAQLRRDGHITDLQWTEVQNCLMRLTDSQGKAERIKNFPYPRNFSSATTYLLLIFILLLPCGLLREYDKLGDGTLLQGLTIWLNIPLSATVTWVFFSLDAVGESAVNPFEGGANDIPITQISRTIEIDLREMLGETDLPPAIQPVNNIVL